MKDSTERERSSGVVGKSKGPGVEGSKPGVEGEVEASSSIKSSKRKVRSGNVSSEMSVGLVSNQAVNFDRVI